ncbi:MAG: response regulator [Gammaproteobacteria bacterium]|nr:response regulator [Gammaproteobacteria bacterium]
MKKILIVDDEPHAIRILRQALERSGYEVDGAANGLAALEKIHEQVPDVLITDIQMPRMSGQQLCQQIQQQMPQRKFLIFIVTSRTEIEHREWSAGIENMMFLEKPVSVRQLIIKLGEYFNHDEGCPT